MDVTTLNPLRIVFMVHFNEDAGFTCLSEELVFHIWPVTHLAHSVLMGISPVVNSFPKVILGHKGQIGIGHWADQ